MAGGEPRQGRGAAAAGSRFRHDGRVRVQERSAGELGAWTVWALHEDGEDGYIHDGRWIVHGNNPNELPWRLKAKEHHTGMGYPTHGLGPVAFAMNINRGDRFDYLVSTGSSGFGYQDFARRKFGKDSFVAKTALEYNDINTTTIRTVKKTASSRTSDFGFLSRAEFGIISTWA